MTHANKVIILLLSLIVSRNLHAEPAQPAISYHLLRWHECAATMAATFPLSDNELAHVLHTVAVHSVNRNPDFLQLVSAVAAAESSLNRTAVNVGNGGYETGAVGLMQLTLIGAKEAEHQCPVLRPTLGESNLTLMLRLLDVRDNVKYGSCLLNYYLEFTNGNVLHALVLYNGGYQQLTRLIRTGTLTTETQQYVLRVHSYLGRCL
jgi:soluble lytic murein transglycosylase-like protein